MERKICTRCNREKSDEDLYNKYTKCEICKSNRSLERYYENKDEMSTQKKIFYE